MIINSEKKLNIAMVCDPLSDYTAGIFVSTWHFASGLKAKGHKVIFIAAASPAHPKDDQHNGFSFYRFLSVYLPKTEGAWRIALPGRRKIKKILLQEKIDIVHILLPLPSALIVAKVAKKLGIKIVAHSHSQPENIFLHLPSRILQKPLNTIFDHYLSWIYNHANTIIYPSLFAKKILNKLTKNIKSEVISNGVDTSVYQKQDYQWFVKKFQINPKNKTILFVGRLHPEKCVDILIKAIPEVLTVNKKINVLIVGEGHLEEKLKKLSSKLEVFAYVNFLGKLSKDELVAAYNCSDMFVLPSVAELEGMVVLEAMACGKPVIIANAPASASVYFVNNNGFLFEPYNEHDLADKIIKLFNTELAKKMGQQSLINSRNYDLKNSVDSLEKIYYELL